jgi:hypothetical protein
LHQPTPASGLTARHEARLLDLLGEAPMTKPRLLLAALAIVLLPTEAPALAAAPVPRVEKKPGGLGLTFSRDLGNKKFTVRTDTRKFMGDHVVTFQVVADAVRIDSWTLQPETHKHREPTKGVSIELKVTNRSSAPAVVEQIERCHASSVIATALPDSSAEKPLRWGMSLELTADQFAIASEAIAKATKDKTPLSLSFDATELTAFGCGFDQRW